MNVSLKQISLEPANCWHSLTDVLFYNEIHCSSWSYFHLRLFVVLTVHIFILVKWVIFFLNSTFNFLYSTFFLRGIASLVWLLPIFCEKIINYYSVVSSLKIAGIICPWLLIIIIDNQYIASLPLILFTY